MYEAIKQVRADEIAFFRLLVWLRRGGRKSAPGILNPGTERPLLEAATSSGFIYLADDPPQEIVVGTIVIGHGALTPDVFHHPPPGFAVAAMNFLVRPDGDGSLVSTDTRIYANGASARRRFGVYWAIIYPGSAFIRRMWLRAISRSAVATATAL